LFHPYHLTDFTKKMIVAIQTAFFPGDRQIRAPAGIPDKAIHHRRSGPDR
jgi:hypothetical protein